LTGSNSYGPTTISAGTLQIGSGGTSGTLGTGAITNTGSLEFNRSDTLTVANAISGTNGRVTQAGTGTTILTGSNSYSGPTTISAGTLRIGSGSTSGTLGTGAVTNNGSLVFNRSNTLTVANAISGTGTVTQEGTGTTILTGTNTYSGTTTISAGTLQLGTGTTAALTGTLGAGAVTNNGSLVFERFNALTVANAISGTGNVTQSGAGTTTLTGANTYSGTTTITSGTLQVGNGGTSGTLGTGPVTNNDTLVFNRSDTVTVANAISGTNGRVTQIGTGTTILTGSNSYTGPTTISAGTLQIGNGGTTGTLGTLSVENNSALTFNRSDTVIIANTLFGTGRVTQAGAGTTILTGTISYSGGTTISAGALQVGNGATGGGTAGSGAITNNATLVINRSNTVAMANAISGTGTVMQAGTGITVLTGANSYSGATTIGAGTLQVGNGGTSGTLGTGAVTNNGSLVFNRNNTLTVANAIGGTGTVRQAGTGMTVLTGANSYSGTTTISGGTLQVGNGGTTGTLGTGGVTNNASLIFNRSDTLTVTNAIGGTGTVTQASTGTTILTGSNSYTGATTISAGTLQVGNGGTSGTLGTGAVTNNSGLVFSRSNSLTVANAVSGAGTVTQAGTGTTILTGTNSYSGATTISAGTLQVGSGGAGGTLGTGAIINNGTLVFNRNNTLTVANTISGAGTVTQAGTGTTVLTGTNNYSGPTTISAGTLQVGNGGTSGTLGTGAVTANGGLVFNRSNTLTLSNAISGTGTVTQAGPGTTVLTGANSYNGTTTISGGTLQVGDGGTSGTLGAGSVTNNTNLAFNRSDTLMVANAIGGAGTVTQAGPGTTILTGTNNYSGATTISAGTLQVGDGGTTGTLGSGAVVTNAAVVFDRSDAVMYAGGISGTGSLTKNGGGTLTLSGMSTYTGATSVNAGTLFVNGVLGNTVTTVAPGATLGGTGTLAGATTIDGSTLSPGVAGTPGTLASGPLTLTDGALLAYDLGAANVVGPQNDLTNVSGNLTLDGTLNVTDVGAFASRPGSYRLLGYTGALTDNTLDVGTTPGYAPGEAAIQTAIPGKINLVVASGMNVAFWDGAGAADDNAIAGGTQTWNNAAGNWTNVDGGFNQSWLNGMAIFDAAPGTVTLGADVQARALQFAAHGYVLEGSGFSLQMDARPGGEASLVRVDPGATATINAPLAGTSGLEKAGIGTLVLGGANTYTGATTISGGTLRVNGSLASSSVAVNTGTTLGGAGTIAGAVTVDANGTLSPGESPGTLTVGSLSLVPGSILNYELSTPDVVGGDVNDLTRVTGALVLDGVLNVTGQPDFGVGSYRLIEYGGALTDNGLALGSMPSGYDYGILTSIAGQVTLDVDVPGPIQYWNGSSVAANGTVNGGSGVWTAGPTNWTNARGTTAAPWRGQVAVFQGVPGTVTVQGPVDFSGLRFLTSDYTITAGAGGLLQTSTSDTVIFVDAGATAMLDVPIAGRGGLHLQGGGTLTLTGANSYLGGTTIGDGTLVISSDGNLGSASGRLAFEGGTLQTIADLTSTRAVTIGESGGAIDTLGGTTFVLDGRVQGPGALTKSGDGLLVLTADNEYGGTSILAGTLQVGGCGSRGSLVGDIVNDGVLVFSRADTSTYAGAISGSGGVIKNCTGTQVLRGTNTYAGGTIINAGTLVGDTNSLQGAILDNAALVFDQDGDGAFQGLLFGSGTLAKTGSGVVLLTGDHPLQGMTTVREGTLALEGTLHGPVTVMSGATFDATGAIAGPLMVDGTLTVRSPATGGLGLLAVGDNVVFRSGSYYDVTIDASGRSSELMTSGSAFGGGAVVDVNPLSGNYARVTHYTIIRAAGGLMGTPAVTSPAGNFDPILTRNPTTLFLTVLRPDVPLQPFSVTGNGWGVGGAIDEIKTGSTGDLHAVVRELTALDDAALGSALDAVAGEIHASATQLAAIDGASAMDMVRSELGIRQTWLGGSEDRGSSAPALLGAGAFRPWVRVRSERASFDADVSASGQGERRGAHGADGRLHGFALGADWSLAPHWVLGAGGSYATGSLDLDDLTERTTFSAPRGLFYVGYGRSQWAIDGGISVARTAYERRRAFAFTAIAPTGFPLLQGVDRLAESEPAGVAIDSWIEGRFETPVGDWRLQPTAAVHVARFAMNSWEETGAESLSLRADAQSLLSVQADAGLRYSRASGRWRPYVGGMYRRELSSGRTRATLQLGNGAGGAYDVDGLFLARDLGAAQGGVVFVQDRFSLALGYEARRARRQLQQRLQLAVGF
jgi:autotransporter-associated beta strand protein